MLYLLIRIVIIAIITLITILIHNKFDHISNKRKSKTISFLVVIAIFYVLLLIPFEAEIIKFKSPIDAFQYSYFNEKIINVIEEDDCAFILYGKDPASMQFTVIEKKNDNWITNSYYTSSRHNTEWFG